VGRKAKSVENTEIGREAGGRELGIEEEKHVFTDAGRPITGKIIKTEEGARERPTGILPGPLGKGKKTKHKPGKNLKSAFIRATCANEKGPLPSVNG